MKKPKLVNKNLLFKLSLLLFALSIGAYFRFYNLNWDSDRHLHPDERFLTMVANDSEIPANLGGYLNQDISTFNPENIGFTYYVYGTFPVNFTKYTYVKFIEDKTKLNYSTYNEITIWGRTISATLDTLVILITFLIVWEFEKIVNQKKNKSFYFSSYIKYFAALFYALSVLPIQLAHFFTVDPFLNFFLQLAFYFSLRFLNFWTISPISWWERSIQLFICLFWAGIFTGLAFASKVTSLFFVPLFAFIFFLGPLMFFYFSKTKGYVDSFWSLKKIWAWRAIGKSFLVFASLFIFFSSIAYFTLRIADPYLFEEESFFDPTISQGFIADMKSSERLNDPATYFPPLIQWLSKTPVIFSLNNIYFFGLGIVIGILVFIGIANYLKKYLRWNILGLLGICIFIWMLGFFIYQSSRIAQTMRYFIIIYPLLAFFAAIAWYEFVNVVIKFKNFYLKLSILTFVFFLVMLWPLMFKNIYAQKHSRIQASEWIYENISPTEVILVESWDDGLPLPLKPIQYNLVEVHTFPPDTPDKINALEQKLREGDYYIMSSNRAWASIMAVSDMYPWTSNFYKELLAGERGYEIVKTFQVMPELCLPFLEKPCISIDDQWADEAFTVYDHPEVIILKKK